MPLANHDDSQAANEQYCGIWCPTCRRSHHNDTCPTCEGNAGCEGLKVTAAFVITYDGISGCYFIYATSGKFIERLTPDDAAKLRDYIDANQRKQIESPDQTRLAL